MESKSGSKTESKTPLRLEFLDGLRGLAALYVVLFHLSESGRLVDLNGATLLPPLLHWATAWMHYGHYAVAVFIVLSGYSLMLPLARSGDMRLRGGMGRYILRRARRILPPYYAALLLSLLCLAATHHLDIVSRSAFVSHLVLLHNLNASWNTAINIPLWSVATEGQIYFLFPLVLLPLWRYGGVIAALAGGFVLGLLPHFLLPRAGNFDWACPWYLGLFTLGMAAAMIHFAPAASVCARLRNLPWPALTLGCAVVFAGMIVALPRVASDDSWGFDLLAGLVAACLVCACAQTTLQMEQTQIQQAKDQKRKHNATAKRSGLLRVVEHPFALLLGMFSYSLYLTHILVKWGLYALLGSRNMPPALLLTLLLGVGVPCSLLVAWIFYQVVERHFVAARPVSPRSPADRAASAPQGATDPAV